VRALLLVPAVALLALAPLAGAFHGASYHATGQAIGTDGVVYNAAVDWCGYDAYYRGCGGYETYHVVITDATTGAAKADSGSFPGTWQGGGPEWGNNEILLYHGTSTDPAVSFDLKGVVWNQFSPCHSKMVYVGNYQDYQLVLTVDQGC
jgi:hypothetical protein